MRTTFILLCVAAVAVVGCGESRLRTPTGPGGAGGIPGGAPGSGSFSDCDGYTTERQCVGQGSRDPILSGLVVRSTGDVISLQLPVEYASDRRAQGVVVVVQRNGQKWPFLRPGESCPVVPDLAGVDGTRQRDFGTVTGLEPGVYEVVLEHGLDHSCYDPPQDADTSASNWVVVGQGELTVCTP
jgi:hypothetical protein